MMESLKNIFRLSIISLLLLSCSKEDPFPEREIPIESAFVVPSIGGPNQQNQVYFDLSSNTETPVVRDSWDLRFYSDDEFRVSLNTSIYMTTKELEFTDLNNVSTSDVQELFNVVSIGTFDANNVEFVDDFDGDINNTAIAEISNDESENKVYLLNLGYEVGTETPQVGSVAVAGAHRGWKKIRILKQDENYVLQYADLDDTTFQEITIEKETDYNFTFFSFNTNTVVGVEPEKQKWDINFTVFTNEITGFGTYGFTDFIASNNLQNVKAYSVSNDEITFNDFSNLDIETANFSDSQRVIGSSWRFGGGPDVLPQINDAIFFIIQDAEGIFYKIKFLTLTNDDGERGFPQFQYVILQ